MPFTEFPISTILATKALLGLGNVDNTADLQKPISIAVQAALDQKRSLSAAIPLADIAQGGATTGQVLKWNGVAWAPGTDNVGSGGGGGGDVVSVFGRTGAIEPQSNDYTFAQIGAKPTTLSGYGITDAAPSSHVASGGSAHAVATTGAAGFMSATDKTKLDGITSGATANQTDAYLLNRDNHTGAQPISSVTGLQVALDAKAPINNPTFTGTVGGITAAMVGLGAVNNTSDAAKPVSTAQATAISARHVNITFQNAGVAQGSAGTADVINATGALVLARSTNTVSLSVSDATGAAKGIVQLAGALGGTAASPTALGYANAAALASDLAAKATVYAPVTLTGATNLTAAAHANRQIIFNGASADLTIQSDVAGGTTGDDSFEVHTHSASAGVPTIVTPDGRRIVGGRNRIIGATRKDVGGTVSWTLGTTDPSEGQSVTSITYETSAADARCTGYTLGGVAHTVSYPDATHIVDAGGGQTVTYTLDAQGRFISKVVS